MKTETKQCQNCKQSFTIGADDFGFYERAKVPAPTFCPRCRNQRRMAWRNERTLYKRKCGAPGHSEEIISMYAPDSPYIVYDHDYWWSDEWDPLQWGRGYDFDKTFFGQFGELMRDTPHIALANQNAVRTEYGNYLDGNKDCYLIFGGGWNENTRYGNKIMENKDSQDLYAASKNELCYECVNCAESYWLLYSTNCKNCTDSYFLYACRNCNNCFGCTNLVSKNYCIFNEQYSKEEYEKKIKDYLPDTREKLERVQETFRKVYLKSIHRYANIVNSPDSTGDIINNSKNCKFCFDIYHDVEDAKYLFSALVLKDCWDGNGIYKNEVSYEMIDANIGSNNLSSVTIYDSNHVQYSLNCHGSSYLFGCIGLRNKQYCILNKQYSKEEYEKILPRIIEQMNKMPFTDKAGRKHGYGDFFPAELSPHAYNETIAQEYYTLTKEEASEKKFPWKEEVKRDYGITVWPGDLSGNISEVDESILKEIIGCEHRGKCNEQCTQAFKVISNELAFYKKMNIPLPLFCPNCRHYQRLKQRNPLKLWKRKCQCAGTKSGNNIYSNTTKHFHEEGKCPNEFETAYAPDRKEIIYCEQCYQAEVV